MAGKKRGKKARRPALPGRPEAQTLPFPAAVRMFVIGALAVVAAVYAIWRHYTVPRPSMVVPVPAATEIPAPELEPAP